MKVIGRKIVAYFITFVLICSLSYLLTFKGFINENSDFMLYLSSATIQAYAALIAIPLTISAVHLSRMYGSPLVDILIKASKEIFAIYMIIVLVSVFNIVINPTTQKCLFIMLILQLSVCIIPIYPLIERLRDLLAISPPQIMKIIGYPAEIQKLVDKNALFEVNTKLLKGLSLIRSSIMDLSLRDYLSETLEIYSNAISAFPWSDDKKVEERKLRDGRIQRMDMQLLLSNIIRYLDECIVDPLRLTKILPDPHIFYQLFRALNKAFIKIDFINSSVFDDYLRKLSILVKTFAENNRIDALNLFYSMFWSFKENKKEIPAKIVSRAICLSASLIKKLKATGAERGDLILAFLITSQAFIAIKDNPKIFAWLDSESIKAWVYLIEEANRTDLGWMIICLPFIENELGKIKEYEPEFIYNRALANFSKILSKIKEKLVKNQWIIFVTENSLNIMNIKDRTIGSVQLENILQNDEIELLKSFIIKHLN